MGLVRTVVFVALCFVAQASFGADQGFYFGLNAGQAKYDFAYERPRIPTSILPPAAGFTPNPIFLPRNPGPPFVGGVLAIPLRAFWLPGNDDEATAFGGFVGYRIFPYAAVELAYADLGTLHEYQPARVLTPTITAPAITSALETTGPALSALAIVPLSERWEVYLRGGMLFADQKVSHSSVGLNEETTYGSDSLLFGAGIQFDFGAHWTGRLDFQRYDSVGEDNGIGEADIDVWSLGVLFRL